MLNQAIRRAEEEGRVIGWGDGTPDQRTYGKLNKFLEAEGYDRVPNLEGEEGFLPALVLVKARFSNHELTFTIT